MWSSPPIALRIECRLCGESLSRCGEPSIESPVPTRCLTRSPSPHVLTNVNVFSPDGKWIVYDIRSRGGDVFDGTRIERVHVEAGEIDVLFAATNNANVGVATYHPSKDQVVFIQGPDHPTPDFTYGAARRHGLVLDVETHQIQHLDARDLVPPFTPGALRGGTHVHVYSPDGTRVSSTYEDHILDSLPVASDADRNQRTIAVSGVGKPVTVRRDHPRNHDGIAWTVVVAQTVNEPAPGSDQINRAFEEAWVGTKGYLRTDGSRQRDALAFQGNVILSDGRTISEVFIVDLPDDLSRPADRPLQGTPSTRPAPPAGCVQRRLTNSADRVHPGIQGPRHWLRSAPDGSRIAFLMRDDLGIVQLFTISPNGGPSRQLTRNPHPIASAFTWSADGKWIAHIMNNCVCVTDTSTGETHPLTERVEDALAPKPHACAFSPDGGQIAYLAPLPTDPGGVDQIWLVDFVPPGSSTLDR